MPAPDHTVGQGDFGSSIAIVLRDEDGEPVSLAGATVRFKMAPLEGGALVLDEEASNDQAGDGSDGSKGHVSYEWQEGDTDDAGHFVAEVEVTLADDSIVTFPNTDPIVIQVTPVIGGA